MYFGYVFTMSICLWYLRRGWLAVLFILSMYLNLKYCVVFKRFYIGPALIPLHNSDTTTVNTRLQELCFTHSPSLRVSSSEGSSLKLPHSPHNLFFSIVSTSTSPYAAPSHVNYQYSRVIRLRNIYIMYHTHRKYSTVGTFTIFAK